MCWLSSTQFIVLISNTCEHLCLKKKKTCISLQNPSCYLIIELIRQWDGRVMNNKTCLGKCAGLRLCLGYKAREAHLVIDS